MSKKKCDDSAAAAKSPHPLLQFGYPVGMRIHAFGGRSDKTVVTVNAKESGAHLVLTSFHAPENFTVRPESILHARQPPG